MHVKQTDWGLDSHEVISYNALRICGSGVPQQRNGVVASLLKSGYFGLSFYQIDEFQF